MSAASRRLQLSQATHRHIKPFGPGRKLHQSQGNGSTSGGAPQFVSDTTLYPFNSARLCPAAACLSATRLLSELTLVMCVRRNR